MRFSGNCFSSCSSDVSNGIAGIYNLTGMNKNWIKMAVIKHRFWFRVKELYVIAAADKCRNDLGIGRAQIVANANAPYRWGVIAPGITILVPEAVSRSGIYAGIAENISYRRYVQVLCANVCAERKNGAPGAIPTRDLSLRRRALYATELREHVG